MNQLPQMAAHVAAMQQFAMTLNPALYQMQAQVEKLMVKFEPLFTQLDEAQKHLAAFLGDATKALAPLQQGMVEFSTFERRCRALEKVGWLPHPTMTHEVMDTDPASLNEAVLQHYAERWNIIEADFIERLFDLDIDAETKAVFEEALSDHREGRYRSVSRLLFPEIERLARIELHAGALERPITSQKQLREFVGELPLIGGFHHFYLYETLVDHLYMKTETPDQLAKAAVNGVPNRHAALHGLLPYNKAQNSLNMIFMFDFILTLISYSKKSGYLKSGTIVLEVTP